MTLPPGSSVIITVAWPPPVLFPNEKRRTHWAVVLKAKQQYRDASFWLAKTAFGRAKKFAAPPHIQVAFFPPDARSRDDDGMIGAFKHARDGIAAAIGFDDRTWRPTYSFHAPHRPDGKIVVVLTATEET